MLKIKITAIRKADYKDLQQKYENPIKHTCDIQGCACVTPVSHKTALSAMKLCQINVIGE
ncbi:hypothetical protein [Treponema sp.]|uniref:hypothetical protein n=1 Tax=Treponema sp. TaxID=166 RepID=UPI00388EE1CE